MPIGTAKLMGFLQSIKTKLPAIKEKISTLKKFKDKLQPFGGDDQAIAEMEAQQSMTRVASADTVVTDEDGDKTFIEKYGLYLVVGIAGLLMYKMKK
jgi:hypothetical protein